MLERWLVIAWVGLGVGCASTVSERFDLDTSIADLITNLEPTAPIRALRRAHEDGKLLTLVEADGWVYASGFNEGPMESIEWFEGTAVIFTPRWGQATSLEQQLALIGVTEPPTRVGTLHYSFVDPHVPASVPLYSVVSQVHQGWLFVTRDDGAMLQRVVHQFYGVNDPKPGPDLKRAFTPPPRPGAASLSYIRAEDVPAQAEAEKTKLEGESKANSEKAQAEAEKAQAEAEKAQAEAEKAQAEAAQVAEAAATRKASEEEARAAKQRDELRAAISEARLHERAPLLSRLLDRVRLRVITVNLQPTVYVSELPALKALDVSLCKALAAEVAVAAREGRTATAGTLRLIHAQLMGAPVGNIEFGEALRSTGNDEQTVARRELASLVLQLVPNATRGGKSWELISSAGNFTYDYDIWAGASTELPPGPQALWVIADEHPTKRVLSGGTVIPGKATTFTRENESPAMTAWKAKLHRLREEVDALESRLAQAKQAAAEGSYGSSGGSTADWGYHQETITLGTGKEATRATVARRNASPSGGGYSSTTAPNPVREAANKLDEGIRVFNDTLDHPPEAMQVTVTSVGAATKTAEKAEWHRSVRLTIEGQERILSQTAKPENSDYGRMMNQFEAELRELLQVELGKAVSKRIEQRLLARGARWAAPARELEAKLLRSMVLNPNTQSPIGMSPKDFQPYDSGR